jgi:Winged helix DNA-binding domain
VCGVQAQNTRAAALALRCRVRGLTRYDVDRGRLVRTWTVRGTVHLIAESDRAWLHAVCAPRFRRRFEALIAERGGLEIARGLLSDLTGLLETPRTRASLLTELGARGHPGLQSRWVNVLLPWVAQQGLLLGLPDGRLRAADPPEPVDQDEALATMARRYLEGYGPATGDDLASWAGLPLGVARRALDAIGPLERAGTLLAVPGTLDDESPPPPPARLLPAFDTSMLGYRSREPLLRAEHDHHILPGGGILRPAALARGTVTGSWRLAGRGATRTLELDWFGRPATAQALAEEAADLGRFLEVHVEPPA